MNDTGTALGTLLMLSIIIITALFMQRKAKRRNGNINLRSGRLYDRS